MTLIHRAVSPRDVTAMCGAAHPVVTRYNAYVDCLPCLNLDAVGMAKSNERLGPDDRWPIHLIQGTAAGRLAQRRQMLEPMCGQPVGGTGLRTDLPALVTCGACVRLAMET